MKKDCDNCGFYNAIMEGCGSRNDCKKLSEWIPISQRKVLAGRIRNLKKHKSKKSVSS